MIKISAAVKNIFEQQPFLESGLNNKIFNLSALAKFLKPMVEARTKKDIRESAILMCLSRLERTRSKRKNSFQKIEVVDITIHSNLCSVSFYASKEVFDKIHLIYSKVNAVNGFISMIHGVNEINLIIDEKFFDLVGEHIKERARNVQKKIASLNVHLNEKTCNTPGQFYSLIQAISMQGINIREITSAFNDAMFYVDQADVKLAFDTLYRCFCENERRK